MAKSRRTKSLDIPPSVKSAVWERDGQRCILCSSIYGQPNAHFIPRSHGGLGIERNVVTLCPTCHTRYDQTTERAAIKLVLAEYLAVHYDGWCEGDLYYRK